MVTVTSSYLDGIAEGREYLNKFRPNKEEMVAILENIKTTLKGFSGPVADLLRGERDFWKNQIARQ